MLAEVLHWLGVPGQFVLLATFAFGAYHFKELLGVATVATMWMKMAVVFVGVLVVGVSGVVPGFSVHVDVGVLLDLVGELVRLLVGVVR